VIEELDRRLRNWAKSALPDAEVSFAPPGAPTAQPRVVLYLHRVARTAPDRGQRRAPLDLEARYLVTASHAEPEEAHRLLDRLLESAAMSSEFELDFAGTAEVFSALGIAPQPAFEIRASARRELSPERIPTVSRPPKILLHGQRAIEGVVLGPGKLPVHGARVVVRGVPRAARTDSRGRFRLSLPNRPKAVYQLAASGKGMRGELLIGNEQNDALYVLEIS
jgi:hypothetical protein